MSTYTPDCWVILKITTLEDTCYKILAGWYGGFTNGDSWKLSSGTVEVNVFENYYEFPQHSGSTYICNKQCERTSSLTASMLRYWTESVDFEKMGIEIISAEKFLEEWNGTP